MTAVTLLNPDDPMFGFVHAMEHRTPMAIMPTLSHYSVMPYFLDPIRHRNVPAGPWHLNHQRSHDDFNSILPSYYNYNPTNDINIPFRIMQTHLLVEGDGRSGEDRTWWTFVNHQEHHILNDAILPIPSGELSDPDWASLRHIQYPFW
jgi:hypothetical protein